MVPERLRHAKARRGFQLPLLGQQGGREGGKIGLACKVIGQHGAGWDDNLRRQIHVFHDMLLQVMLHGFHSQTATCPLRSSDETHVLLSYSLSYAVRGRFLPYIPDSGLSAVVRADAKRHGGDAEGSS